MRIPEYLQNKIDLFKANGRIFREDEELFNQTSWLSVMVGQGIIPNGYHPMVDILDEVQIQQRMSNVRDVINKSVDYMPSHQEFIDKNCKASM